MSNTVNIIGAGEAGLSAAVTLAKRGIKSRLISDHTDFSEEVEGFIKDGLIIPYSDHSFAALILEDEGTYKRCRGIKTADNSTGECQELKGQTILDLPGMDVYFAEEAGDSSRMAGEAASLLFAQGVTFSGLEMVKCETFTKKKRRLFRKPLIIEKTRRHMLGGIDVDGNFRTDIEGLFAVGQCCNRFHVTDFPESRENGGERAANYIADRSFSLIGFSEEEEKPEKEYLNTAHISEEFRCKVRDILANGVKEIRDDEELTQAGTMLEELIFLQDKESMERKYLLLAKAMLLSAIARKESRGIFSRADYPETDDSYNGIMTISFEDGEMKTGLREDKPPIDPATIIR